MSNLRACCHGFQKRLHFVSSFPHSRFSTITTRTTETTGRKTAGESPLSMADYLVNSFGFSREQASATAKSRKLISEQNANSVIVFFRKLGLDETQIHNTVRSFPSVLNRDVEESLTPRIRAFQELGLSGTFLSNFIASDPKILGRDLESVIQPKVELLKSIFGSGEDVRKALLRSTWLFSGHNFERLQGNLMLLQRHGLSSQRIKQLLMLNPKCLLSKRELLEQSLAKVEEILGLKPDSPMFIYAIPILLFDGEEVLRSKYELFKSYGWSESEVATLARKQPLIFGLKPNTLKGKLNFLMNELGYMPEYLIRHCFLLTISLEKRIIPRAAVLRVLKEKMLANFSFYSVMCLRDTKFLELFLLPYKDVVPEIYEAYVKNKMGSLTEEAGN